MSTDANWVMRGMHAVELRGTFTLSALVEDLPAVLERAQHVPILWRAGDSTLVAVGELRLRSVSIDGDVLTLDTEGRPVIAPVLAGSPDALGVLDDAGSTGATS